VNEVRLIVLFVAPSPSLDAVGRNALDTMSGIAMFLCSRASAGAGTSGVVAIVDARGFLGGITVDEFWGLLVTVLIADSTTCIASVTAISTTLTLVFIVVRRIVVVFPLNPFLFW
jgi:hypothetical protein